MGALLVVALKVGGDVRSAADAGSAINFVFTVVGRRTSPGRATSAASSAARWSPRSWSTPRAARAARRSRSPGSSAVAALAIALAADPAHRRARLTGATAATVIRTIGESPR